MKRLQVLPKQTRRINNARAHRSNEKAHALNTKQLRFIAEYQVDGNATKAAERSGYSKKTAGQIGERLLKKVEIKAAITVAEAQRLAKLDVTVERVRAELAKVAFGPTAPALAKPSDKIAALNTLAKHLRYDRQQIGD
jgi:phage terminase small subunit